MPCPRYQAMQHYIRDNRVGFDIQYANKSFGLFPLLYLQGQFEGALLYFALPEQGVT